ncbi:Vacuolar assembling protein [Mycena chlorophos]|uniref:Vacuolar assembling protein n=1 Tax=Mycena chlorophos TaxID=658473 RepID=A0A8H6WMT0_MYCCL|nr:Vacuolar assembling protein [Mycena chlorophos]
MAESVPTGIPALLVAHQTPMSRSMQLPTGNIIPFTEEDVENLCKFLSGQRPLEGGRHYRSNVFYDKLVEDKDGAAHWAAKRHSAASWYRYYRRHQQELDTRILALQREEVAAAAASAIQSSVDLQRSLEVRVESSILPEAIEGDEGIKNLIMPVPSQSATSRRTVMEPDLVNSLKKLAIDATPTSNDDDINANRQMNGKSSLSSVEPPPEPRVSGQVVTALGERSNQPFSLSSTPATMDAAARAFDMHAFLFADALDTGNSLTVISRGKKDRSPRKPRARRVRARVQDPLPVFFAEMSVPKQSCIDEGFRLGESDGVESCQCPGFK